MRHSPREVLVIGGGVVGLSVAYELARHAHRVTVLDKGLVGREASWAGAGILPPAKWQTATHPIEQLRGLSYERHAAWAAELRQVTGIDTGYRVCGGLYFARGAGEAATLAAAMHQWRDEGFAVERLPASEITRLEPAVGASETLRAAWLVPEEAQLRNPRHLRALTAACRRLDVAIEEHHAVSAFRREGRRVVSLEAGGRVWTADDICVTAGPWSRTLLEELGFGSDVFPVRGQMLLYRLAPGRLKRIVNEGTRYLVPREDGRILTGSTEEEVGFCRETTEAGLAELRDFATALIPELSSIEPDAAWSGLRPASFDGLPYLGRLPGLDNAYVATGHFRSGISLSTGTALIMRQLIEGEEPEIDVAPFRVDRLKVLRMPG